MIKLTNKVHTSFITNLLYLRSKVQSWFDFTYSLQDTIGSQLNSSKRLIKAGHPFKNYYFCKF